MQQTTLRELTKLAAFHSWVNMTPKQREDVAYDAQFEEWKKTAIAPVTETDLNTQTAQTIGGT